jgi:hypothetical protein
MQPYIGHYRRVGDTLPTGETIQAAVWFPNGHRVYYTVQGIAVHIAADGTEDFRQPNNEAVLDHIAMVFDS